MTNTNKNLGMYGRYVKDVAPNVYDVVRALELISMDHTTQRQRDIVKDQARQDRGV